MLRCDKSWVRNVSELLSRRCSQRFATRSADHPGDGTTGHLQYGNLWHAFAWYADFVLPKVTRSVAGVSFPWPGSGPVQTNLLEWTCRPPSPFCQVPDASSCASHPPGSLKPRALCLKVRCGRELLRRTREKTEGEARMEEGVRQYHTIQYYTIRYSTAQFNTLQYDIACCMQLLYYDMHKRRVLNPRVLLVRCAHLITRYALATPSGSLATPGRSAARSTVLS